MDLKILLAISLFPIPLLSQTQDFPAGRQLFLKKTPVPARPKTPKALLTSQDPESRTPTMTQGDYARISGFLNSITSAKDRRSEGEKLWGTALGLAGTACAAVVAVEILDKSGKKKVKKKEDLKERSAPDLQVVSAKGPIPAGP